MQNYMLERLLERISLSPYKDNFILKGGSLISVIVGLDTRTTMDLDTTIKGFTLTHDSIREIISEICAVEIEDDVTFSIADIMDIRETDDYPGIRVSLKANYEPISVPLTVDVTTGDIITPREIRYTFRKRRSIHVLQNYADIVEEIKNDGQMRVFWKKYRKILIMQRIFPLMMCAIRFCRQ